MYLEIAKIYFHGVLLSFILVCKIPEFWRCKLWDQNFVSFSSGNTRIKEVKNQVLLFLSSWEPNLSDLMIYFCLFQNAILHRVETNILKFSAHFSQNAVFIGCNIFSLLLVIFLSWNLHLKLSHGFLTLISFNIWR